MPSIYNLYYLCLKCFDVENGRQKRKLWSRYNEVGVPIDYGDPPRCPNCASLLKTRKFTKGAFNRDYNFQGEALITSFKRK